MLILSRKKGESIIIGEDIRITIIDFQKNQVKIGIEAPRGVTVLREELIVEVEEENQRATQIDLSVLNELPEVFKKNKKDNR